MTDPRALLDAYAALEFAGPGAHQTERIDKIAPEAFAALRAVLDFADEMDKPLSVGGKIETHTNCPCPLCTRVTCQAEVDRTEPLPPHMSWLHTDAGRTA